MLKITISVLCLFINALFGYKGYPPYKDCQIKEQKLQCFPESCSPGVYLHPSVTAYIDKKQVSSVFEIGSRDALDALRLSLYYKCHVYTFECNPECLPVCQHNSGLTQNVTVIDKALWDQSGTIDFFPIVSEEGKIRDPGSSSCFPLLPKHLKSYSQTQITVPALRLDTWMKENECKGVDLICMSTQGAALKILQGMGSALKKTKFIVTRCETEPLYEGESLLPELTAFLKTKGFERVPTELVYDYLFINKKYLKQAQAALPKIGEHAISYEYCAGRFGDKILGYAQARYLSYITSLPFLCRPFPNSEYLTIEYQSLPFEERARRYSNVFHIKSAETLTEFFRKIRDPNTPPTLFMLDYFPSDISEWDWPTTWWTSALVIPWKEESFAKYLKKSLEAKMEIPDFTVKERLNVADHVRYLSGPDTVDSLISFPLKSPNLDYHERQIRRVYEWNGKKPMHVFIFTDSKSPLEVVEQMRRRFPNEDILFNIQVLENPDINHVVKDFFAMQKFEVLIATQSNISMMASRLADFDMVIYPVHAIGEYPNLQIDRIQLITKKSKWFPHPLNIVLRENLPR